MTESAAAPELPAVGFSTNVYDNPADIVGHLKFLAGYFDDIEMEIAEEAQDVLFGAGPAEYEQIVAGVRGVMDEHGLDMSVHAAWFGSATDLSAADEDERAASKALLSRSLRFARDIGVSRVTYHPGYRTGRSTTDCLGTLKRSITEMQPLAADCGVTLCLENMGANRPRLVTPTPGQLADLCESTGTALTLDVTHLATIYKDERAFDDALAQVVPYTQTVHISDLPDRKHAHFPIGEGNFDLAGALRRLGELGYHGAAIVEEFVKKYPPELYLERAAEFRRGWRASSAAA